MITKEHKPIGSHGQNLVGNQDIWREILGHLEVCLGEQSAEEIAENRRTMYRIALLTSGVTDLALDSLWKSMSSLEPVVRALNPVLAPGDTSQEQNVFFQPDRSFYGGSWIMRNPEHVEERRIRMEGYLYRIKELHLNKLEWREVTLWPTLRGLMDSGDLLPRVKSLSIDFTSTRPTCPWVNLLEPILSPSLENLYMCAPPDEVQRFEQACSMANLRCNSITRITYFGAPSPTNLVKICSRFKKLRTLKLNYENHQLQRPEPPSQLRLEDFPELTELEVDIRAHPLLLQRDTWRGRLGDNIREEVGPHQTFNSLQILHVIGDSVDLKQLFINSILNAPNLHSLIISIDILPGDAFWTSLFSFIFELFPCITSLSLRRALRSSNSDMRGAQRYSILGGDDLTKFLGKGSITSFCLENIPHSLTDDDFSKIITSWPHIEQLRILNAVGRQWFCSTTILIQLSRQLKSLKRLALPLNFSAFTDPLPQDHISTSRLRHLVVTAHGGGPEDSQGKTCLATNLIMLFPKLVSISLSDHNRPDKYYVEFNKLIDFYHRGIVIYLSHLHLIQK